MKKHNTGYWIAIFLSGIPLILWAMGETFPYKFTTIWDTLTSLGQAMGLVGMILFACALILSARFKWYEPLFGGMNKVYIAHHTLGGIGFLFLIVHPLFLATALIQTSWKSAALYILPGDDFAINLGISAFLLLMALLIVTYYVNLPYQIWKLTHQFMGLAFFLGGLHVFFITSDVSTNTPLRYYMLSICVIGLLCYVYRTLLGKFLVPRYLYEILNIKRINDAMTEITMIPKNKEMNFQAGQFVFVSFLNAPIPGETHPFSISNAPGGKKVRISIKSLGDYTSLLPVIPKGTLVKLEGPYGKFTPMETQSKQIWIAGGIGITPFIGMAAFLATKQIDIDLYYTVRTQSEAVYLDELQQLAAQNPGFRIFLSISTINGRLTADAIHHNSGDLSQTEIFVCGPPSLMIAIKKQLRAFGIKKEQIHSEEFEMN
jgi:predicted ferric reductase